jgi:hypothetical protein
MARQLTLAFGRYLKRLQAKCADQALDWFRRVLNFLIRPTISQDQAFTVMRQAATLKGWTIGEIHSVGRTMHLYEAIAFIERTTIAVLFMVDGRSGKIMQIERSDDLEEMHEDHARR